jgi:hypothetical protein
MDPCTVETGLLRKKPCGHAAVTHCANCEQPLCSQHAIAQVTDEGKKSGKFMCKECDAARREYEKTTPAAAPSQPQKKTPAAEKGAAAAPAAPAKAPAAPAKAPAAPAKDASTEGKSGGSDGGIDFTPSKK